MALKYDLSDIVAEAIINKEPVVIVEGKDDYKIYQTIANEINPKIKVYQVNEFANYESGCRGVIKCLEFLKPIFEERASSFKYRKTIRHLDILYCYE